MKMTFPSEICPFLHYKKITGLFAICDKDLSSQKYDVIILCAILLLFAQSSEVIHTNHY